VSRRGAAKAHSNGGPPGASPSHAGRDGSKNPTKNPRHGVGPNPTLIPGNPGNSGGKLGRSGRLPEEFRQALRDLASRPDILRRLAKILGSPKTSDNDFLAAHKYVAERGYGKVPTVIEGGDQRKPLVIRLVREGKQ
jgi:hypothetical protein